MPFITDADSTRLPPHKIVSLVPSQTELLYDLGLEQEVVGITKFCVHPEHWFRNKKRIGGTKTIHIEEVLALQPDLVLANKEENTQEQIEQLAKDLPVWMSDIQTIAEALDMIASIGRLTHRSEKATEMIKAIDAGWQQIQAAQSRPKVLYLIWQNPWMAAGSDTFIHSVLERAGLGNVLGDWRRYPELTEKMLVSANPDWVMLSSEPYPFKEEHIATIKSILPQAHCSLVDGELLSWYGSRLLQTAPYLQQLIDEYESRLKE